MKHPYVVASKKVAAASNSDLKTIWDTLDKLQWTGDDYYADDVTMTEWAALIYSEMNRRGLPTG